MIKIGDNIIMTLDEFKAHFDLELMWTLVKNISIDKDIFEYDGKELQQWLRYVITTDAKHKFAINSDSAGMLRVKINDCEVFVVKYTGPEIFSGCSDISKDDLISLLLCEMGAVMYNRDESVVCIDKNLSQDRVEIKTGTISKLSTNLEEINPDDPLKPVVIKNISKDGYAYVFLEQQYGEDVCYQIDGGNRIVLLQSGGVAINKIPQLSLSANHAIYMQYESAKVRVVCENLNNKERIYVHTFDADKLTQVCADERGGFVALIDGEILSYSLEIQPEDIECLRDEIPEGETIEMICIISKQIVALTNAKKVYSNYPYTTDMSRKVVWLEKMPDGSVRHFYQDDYKEITNSDNQLKTSRKVRYNNGKIEL